MMSYFVNLRLQAAKTLASRFTTTTTAPALSAFYVTTTTTTSRCFHNQTTITARSIFSSNLGLTTSLSAAAAYVSATINNNINNDHQLTTTRQRWTKAKKKRRIRLNRRAAWVAKGKPWPRPNYYTPIETNVVVNAIDREKQRQDIALHDAKVSEEIQEKLKAAKAKLFLRHSMSAPTGKNDCGLVMSDRVRKLFDLKNGSQSEVIQAQKHQGMEIFQLRPSDTGSTAVQVVALTTRIQQLQTHMHMHNKDKHSKRGMDALYVRRRKLLDYLERKDFESYRRVVKTLGLTR
jgi:small subunit ribosomal protein S15